MKKVIVFIVLLACAEHFVQSNSFDDDKSDVSNKVRAIGDFEKLLEKLEIPKDFIIPPGVIK
jgi:hypothetical protein